VAASVFEILYRKVCENLIKDDLTPELFTALKGQRVLLENLIINILPEKSSGWIDDKKTPETETFEDIVIRSFKETVADLTQNKEIIRKTGSGARFTHLQLVTRLVLLIFLIKYLI
jgi:hypothetical protein